MNLTLVYLIDDPSFCCLWKSLFNILIGLGELPYADKSTFTTIIIHIFFTFRRLQIRIARDILHHDRDLNIHAESITDDCRRRMFLKD